MRISDWSSDVCSSDLAGSRGGSDRSRFGSTGNFLALEQRRDALFDAAAFDLRGGRQDDAVAKHPGGEALDVVGDSIVASAIGRASCRDRVCQYVSISVVARSSKKKLA